MLTEFSDGKIRIRKIRPDDDPGIFEAVSESIQDLYPWTEWAHEGYKMKESQNWVSMSIRAWEMKREYHFMIDDPATGEILGGCGLGRFDWKNRLAEMGYWVRAGRQGAGIATAAGKLCARAGIERLDLARIELIIDVRNKSSLRVAEKIGAKNEGVLRNRLRTHGTHYDAYSWSILSGDIAAY